MRCDTVFHLNASKFYGNVQFLNFNLNWFADHSATGTDAHNMLFNGNPCHF